MLYTIHVVVGARPNQMKASPLLRVLNEHAEFNPVLIDTGQHYDHELSGISIEQFGMEDPDYSLEVESGTRGVQPVRILEMVENKGTVVIVPQSFGMLESVCERIVSLENGFIKEMGEPEQIIKLCHGRVEPSPNSSSEEKE